jgi:hypothetical protein
MFIGGSLCRVSPNDETCCSGSEVWAGHPSDRPGTSERKHGSTECCGKAAGEVRQLVLALGL